MPEPARLLVVCTANICRSPLGEALLRRITCQQVGPDVIEVASAGVQARIGDAAATETQRIARRWGVDLSDHHARVLTPELVANSDLVLTMTEQQRDDVLRLAASALPRTFAWRELARLATHVGPPATSGRTLDPGERIAAAARAAHRARPLVAGVAHDDIADPVGRSARHYQRMAASLVEGAELFLPLLLLGTPPA